MEFPRMVYRAGGSWALESGAYSVRTVDSATELDGATAEGWHLDQYAAKAAADTPPAPAEPVAAKVTRADLEAQATAKGLQFDGRTTDKKLAAMIAAAGA